MHEADLLDAGGEHFVEEEGERGLLVAITIRERLQREAALGGAGGGDQGFGDTEGHGDDERFCIIA